MRFSAILAAATMALLSVVSAQTDPNAAAMLACNTCLNNAAIAAVPACKSLEGTKPGTTPSIDAQKACFCALNPNKTWADSCVAPDKCTTELKDMLVQVIATGVAQHPGICDNVSLTSAGTRFCGSSSAKVAAAGAAAMAIAGALL
ncbi:MAG: hypothetical protein JOS17DRAFT_740357 [Linnemannia elongata]|nr:MAG: hypothetical protein JOS17DRAFT_740357 [Linnemannia elongata]